VSNNRRKQDYVRSIYDGFRNNPERNRKAIEERMYLRIFTEIACARFKWVGLPTGIDERFLELTLFNRALAVFYFDESFDRYFALRASGTGKINMYDNPTSYTVIGNTMINKTLKGDECVPIWANFLRMPDWDIASVYATRISEIDRTIEINLLAHRHPFMMFVDDNEKLSVTNAFRQVKEGQPVIVGTTALGDMMDQKVKLLDMKIDKDEVLNLQLVKGKMWNECMTFLGINNANQDKRERLVVSEVSANNSQVLMARNVALDARRQACEIMNRMYGLSVSVHWNVDIDNIAQEKAIESAAAITEA
jgi:hypothetical protein